MSNPLYQIMRFQVLTAALTEGPRSRIEDAYVYAWAEGVWPIVHDGADWHEPFAEQFEVDRVMMNDLLDHFDTAWRSNAAPKFYDLETQYRETEWTRWKLISACRYLYLANRFDESFWQTLMSFAPTEASCVTAPFHRDTDVYFL